MNLLLQQVLIVDKNSGYHLQTRDIYIEQGKIKKIGKKLTASSATKVVKIKGLHVSPGWVDMASFGGEPGFEHKEDFKHLSQAAAFGGFTTVCCLPNTLPPLHSKSEIMFVLEQSKQHIIDILPIGALTTNCAGKAIAEILDMHQHGAVAFSDGNQNRLDAGNLMRCLLYVKAFNGLVIHFPDTPSISAEGLMNESLQSSMLGLKGIPAIAEELEVFRAIELCRYTQSRIHISGLSTSGSLDLMKKAKKEKIDISAGVTPYNLLLSDAEMKGFDVNLKLFPPLRSSADIAALIKGIQQKDIDVISSHHSPHEIEAKHVEFDVAEPGMIGLQTAFAAANTALHDKVNIENIIEALSHRPRAILGLQEAKIEENQMADLSIFLPEKKWTFKAEHILSKSKNTPFLNYEFLGKPLGIVKNNQCFIPASLS